MSCHAISNGSLWFPKVPASCSHLPYSTWCRWPSSSSGECSPPHRKLCEQQTAAGHTERSNNGFVGCRGTENRNMYVFPLCTGAATTAAALFEWHLCHVAACLRRKLSSTEEKLFFCLRDSYPTHTLGHSSLGVLICYVYVQGCLY